MTAPAAASAPAERRLPLRLCEVLEREYITLHGALDYTPEWTLRAEDVLEGFVPALLRGESGEGGGGAVAAVRRKLRAKGWQLAATDRLDEEARRALAGKLDELLRSPEALFDGAFLGCDAEEALLAAALPAEPSAGLAAGDSERALANRLLLEAAFPPDAIARVDTVRLALIFARIHALTGDGIRSAICLSGGGIRSASFALGALQGLARCGVLANFDYLSTVSGGGYTGSWLSAWVHRHPQGLPGVVEALKDEAERRSDQRARKTDPEPGPVRFLRSFSRFLNPRGGLFSVDTWTWVGLYLRNLSLNWLFIIPLLMMLVMLPRLYAGVLFDLSHATHSPFDFFFWGVSACALLVLVCVTVNRPSLSDTADAGEALPRRQRLLGRLKAQRWVVTLGVLPFVLFAVLLTLLVWWLPASFQALSLGKFRQMAGVLAAGDMLEFVPSFAFGHLMIWGEALVVVGWFLALLLLPERGWPRRAWELLAMLLAGAVTWWLVARLAEPGVDGAQATTPAVRFLLFDLHQTHVYAVLAVPAAMIAVLAGMTLFIGLVSKLHRIGDEDREWWARFGAWALICIVGWAAISAIALVGPALLVEFPRLVGSMGGVAGLISLLLGRSSLSPAVESAPAQHAQGPSKGIAAALAGRVLPVASAVFLVAFLAFVSLLTGALVQRLLAAVYAPGSDGTFLGDLQYTLIPQGLRGFRHACGRGAEWPAWADENLFRNAQLNAEIACQTPPLLLLAMTVAIALLIWVAGRAIDLNKFSLHAAYRIRIVRTFLGASRGEDRRPNAFTGFDAFDDVQMHELRPGLLGPRDIRNLGRLVARLQAALPAKDGKAPAAGAAANADAALAQLLVSRAYDRSGSLHERLRLHDAKGPVLKSLQRELIEKLNRVLEAARFDAVEGLKAADGAVAGAALRDAQLGNRIFANRRLLEAAFGDDLRPYEFPPQPPHKLLHVVNLTLNLVHGRRLAWQERKAAPFSVTPLHAGSYYLGYRAARDYGGPDGISLGTAVAVSGAAVSPNMGYSSSPLTALLLTLFNVRLGWWLGNPGAAGAKTYRRAQPHFSLQPLLSEGLGLTDDQSRYVYLSDGGHFENMALYEMVLRRCRIIVVTDAGADPKYEFEDLGNAVRKIRIDLGISVEFSALPIRKRKGDTDAEGRYCAIGRIRYSLVDGPDAPDGLLILWKPVIAGGEPRDVLNYAAQNATFPQQPTSDQFFAESQFESYRQLGQFEVETVCTLGKDLPADQPWAARLVEAARTHLGHGKADDEWIRRWRKSLG